MEKRLMTLFTRTPLHVGAGNSVGVVDSPIQRERHTRIPIIPGSSLKGVLSSNWLEKSEDGKLTRSAEGLELFGEVDPKNPKAGSLLIGEARVLAFPVRSAKNSFAWLTSPFALRRFARDTGREMALPELTDNDQCYASEAMCMNGKVVLEEYCFKADGATDRSIVDQLQSLMDDEIWKSLSDRLVLVSDEMFSYFCEHACEVVTRIKVDDNTGVVKDGALFNQEQVPSETMFYSIIFSQEERLLESLNRIKFLQVGGDETIGLGICSVEVK